MENFTVGWMDNNVSIHLHNYFLIRNKYSCCFGFGTIWNPCGLYRQMIKKLVCKKLSIPLILCHIHLSIHQVLIHETKSNQHRLRS